MASSNNTDTLDETKCRTMLDLGDNRRLSPGTNWKDVVERYVSAGLITLSRKGIPQPVRGLTLKHKGDPRIWLTREGVERWFSEQKSE